MTKNWSHDSVRDDNHSEDLVPFVKLLFQYHRKQIMISTKKIFFQCWDCNAYFDSKFRYQQHRTHYRNRKTMCSKPSSMREIIAEERPGVGTVILRVIGKYRLTFESLRCGDTRLEHEWKKWILWMNTTRYTTWSCKNQTKKQSLHIGGRKLFDKKKQIFTNNTEIFTNNHKGVILDSVSTNKFLKTAK